jgi:hypothetical protein
MEDNIHNINTFLMKLDTTDDLRQRLKSLCTIHIARGDDKIFLTEEDDLLMFDKRYLNNLLSKITSCYKIEIEILNEYVDKIFLFYEEKEGTIIRKRKTSIDAKAGNNRANIYLISNIFDDIKKSNIPQNSKYKKEDVFFAKVLSIMQKHVKSSLGDDSKRIKEGANNKEKVKRFEDIYHFLMENDSIIKNYPLYVDSNSFSKKEVAIRLLLKMFDFPKDFSALFLNYLR